MMIAMVTATMVAHLQVVELLISSLKVSKARRSPRKDAIDDNDIFHVTPADGSSEHAHHEAGDAGGFRALGFRPALVSGNLSA